MDCNLNTRIEDAALNAWPALEQEIYDGWLLRFAGGYTKRANSVNVRYPSRLPFDEKIRYCETVYAEQGLPLIFRLPVFLTPLELDAALVRQGYSRFDPTLVMRREISKVTNIPEGCEVRELPINEWIRLRAALTETQVSHWETHQSILDVIVPRKMLMGLYFEGEPVSCGMVVLEDDFLGYFSIFTALASRRRGFGQVMMAALTRWGVEHSAAFGYLQVEGDNLPAQAMYQKLGFRTCYQYTYSRRV